MAIHDKQFNDLLFPREISCGKKNTVFTRGKLN